MKGTAMSRPSPLPLFERSTPNLLRASFNYIILSEPSRRCTPQFAMRMCPVSISWVPSLSTFLSRLGANTHSTSFLLSSVYMPPSLVVAYFAKNGGFWTKEEWPSSRSTNWRELHMKEAFTFSCQVLFKLLASWFATKYNQIWQSSGATLNVSCA